MALPNSVRIGYEDLRTLDWTAITANYVGVGPIISNSVRMIKVLNSTDSNLLMSFNGIDDKDIAPKNTHFIYDYCSNASSQGGYLELPAESRIYVKARDGVLPTEGTIDIVIIYATSV